MLLEEALVVGNAVLAVDEAASALATGRGEGRESSSVRAHAGKASSERVGVGTIAEQQGDSPGHFD